jgi:hypothetical protein
MLCSNANPGHRGGKPAANLLSYGTALHNCGNGYDKSDDLDDADDEEEEEYDDKE